ncbi:MAG: alpha/beta hydrolase [Burkholderiales bacterium]|nr:alpha/beta hydrolase [Burkholderiales bacterium]
MKPEPAASRIPIVLVHGAWAGGWIWQRVRAPLAAAGFDVHAVTLTGCGERAHLLRREITLQTHIADVVGLVQAEELDEIVLVGHSYGGLVVTGAADALLARGIARVRQIVYVDAIVPLPGECWGQRHDNAVRRERLAAAAATGLRALPPPDPAAFGLGGADRDWLRRRQGLHPFGAYLEPLHFDGARIAALPRAFIDCKSPAFPTIEPMRRRVREMPGFAVVEMATGHCPQVQSPAEFVRLLGELIHARTSRNDAR